MNLKKYFTTLAIACLITACENSFAQSGMIYTIAGFGGPGFSGDGGPASAAKLEQAFGLTLDATGNIYITDNNSIRKIDISTGIINTIAGDHTASGFSGDGGPATAALFKFPEDIAIDAIGNIYIHDWQNNRVRKINTSGIITTVAGSPTASGITDGIPATNAFLGTANAITLDNSGNLYIGMYGLVRKVSTSGIISTVAGIIGSSGFSGDGGPATAARLEDVLGIAFDPAGNLYISNGGTGSHQCIRKVNTSGVISTIAGTGTAGYSGDGGPATAAKLNEPYGLAFDPSGNLVFIDYNNMVLRMVNTSGTISTLAGIGIGSGLDNSCDTGAGVGRVATSAQIKPNMQLAINSSGNIYFGSCNVVNVLSGLAYLDVKPTEKIDFILYPNPVRNELKVKGTFNNYSSYQILNCLGQEQLKNQLFENETIINTLSLPSGIYFIKLFNQNEFSVKRFIKY